MAVIKILAIIPAAGIASRLGTPLIPKELMQVPTYSGVEPVICDSLRRCEVAGVTEVMIVTRPDKKMLNLFIDEYLGSIFPSLRIRRINQRGQSLKGAVLTAVERDKSDIYVVLFPDTITRPVNCLEQVLDVILAGAVLSLGVFPTNNPCELAPVNINSNNEILSIQDKPSRPLAQNTWGIVAFNRLFLQCLIESQSFSESMLIALERKLITRATVFEKGHYIDIGTIPGIREAFTIYEEK